VPIIQISPSLTLADFEDCLQNLPPAVRERSRATLQLETGAASDLLTDIWAAIVCGTLCRRADTDLIYTERDEDGARLATSLAGLSAVSTAVSVCARGGNVLDVPLLKQRLMLGQEGLVIPDSDVMQALVEFDPDYPVAPLFQRADGTEADPRLRRRLFQLQVLRFRQMLDIGALRRGGGPVGQGAAGDLGTFLAELHENGLEHGSHAGLRKLAGTRFLRLRSHAAADPKDLVELCGPFRQLRQYVEKTFTGTDPVTLVEASISDFGLGIVDGFQTSPAGLGPDADRRDVLEQLISGRLTSKSNDPSAGLGIQNALDAARRMHAFVSLRTAEFWMAVSFFSEKPEARLVHLGDAAHPPVAGTHWQIFWPQP
jgi:hypothetical protein